MSPLEMIAEWRKGCSCASPGRPEQCETCTVALIDALERALGHSVDAIEIDLSHQLTLEPQPIADQWMAMCSCGWRLPASMYEFDTRDEAIAHLRKRFKEHAGGLSEAHSVGEVKR